MITATTAALAGPSAEERHNLLAQLGDRAAHDAALRSLPALNHVEVGGSASVVDPPSSLCVAAWNQERGRHPDAAAALLAATGADVVLLSEMDLGMARTDHRHTTADLASRLGMAYAYGVEFVELAVGSATDHREHPIEARQNESAENRVGLHGNAVLARTAISRPAVVRLTSEGAWFEPGSDEPRVGERMALVATVQLAGGGADDALVVASTHLESRSSPDERAAQISILLDALDAYADGRPVVVGGDLNTSSAVVADLFAPGAWEAALAEDPERFADPVAHEPLFAVASAHGYDWRSANAPGVTTRFWSGSRRWRYAMRLDWILTRGLACRSAATIPAIEGDDLDRPLSDHDLLVVTVTPAT